MSLARILGKSKGRQSYAADPRWVLSDCLVGIENEYENVRDRHLPIHTHADFWEYHEEGSLRDNGAEYALAAPLFGIDLWNALKWLVSHAQASGWRCTKRTGIHIHLDVRDLTVPQFAGMSIVYAAVEPILYRWVGEGRANSHFCYPLYKADESLLGACSVIKSAFQDDREDEHSTMGESQAIQRYAGYNLQSLQKFGSTEFRHLQTTHDLQRIEDWINMLMSLKATAFKLPQSDGATVRMLQKMGVLEFLRYVFPDNLVKQLYTKSSEDELFSIGLPSARDIAVHGCGTSDWVSMEYPKGENEGFIKWLKSYSGPKQSKPTGWIDPINFDLPDLDFDDEDEPEDVPLPRVRLEPIRQEDWGLVGAAQGVEVNWRNLGMAAMQNIPVPGPPVDAPLPIPAGRDGGLNAIIERERERLAGLNRNAHPAPRPPRNRR